MDLKKLAPWNWFKKEEEDAGHVPVKRGELSRPTGGSPFGQLQREIDRLFDSFFRGFALSPLSHNGLLTAPLAEGILRPTLDVSADDKDYTISIEVPGINQKDVHVEIVGNTMTIKGEKKQEKEEKSKNYYRMERSYGSFQRILSLPEDADQENIKATFKNGILTINIARTGLPHSEVKQIEIK